ncbi:Pleckstrin homology domain-containing protein [Flammula alnicola]|nr:Pleckstrin homology domain-containing protein [Flammula alnicola]
MKSVSSTNSWILRSHHRDSPTPSDHEPLTPTYTSPRLAPKPPGEYNHSPSSSTFKAGFNSVFNRKPGKAPSLRSAYSTSTATSSSETHSTHPYSAIHMAPLPVVSSHNTPDDDEECPVCLEPLSFSFRLPGEKPHIVPECGHALHEACFTAVYGPPPNQQARTIPRKTNLGVCGVCRRPMKVGDGDGGKSNKLAALTGMGDSRAAPLYPGRDTPTTRARQPPRPYDPNQDDPLDHSASVKSHPAQDHAQYIVAPSIQVRPEFSSLTRTSDPNQPLTCIVVIELPGKRGAGNVPGPVIPDNYGRNSSNGHSHNNHLRPDNSSGHSSPRPDRQVRHLQEENSPRAYQNRQLSAAPENQYPMSSSNGYPDSANYGPNTLIHSEEDSPFTAITEDLRNRIIDWKGHPLSDLGPLQMYDLLHVRRDSAIREFYVYLFKEAIICVVEERKRGLGRLLSNASGLTDTGSIPSSSGQSKGVLRLKGRIYVRHIKNVTASSAAGEMSLTIDMEDELASFILIFKERSSLEAWKNNIQALVNMFQAQNGVVRRPQEPARPLDMEEFGGSAKAMRMLSGSTQTTVSTVDSLLNGSSRSSSTSHSSISGANSRQNNNNNNAGANNNINNNKLATLGEDDELSAYDSPTHLVTPHLSAGPSNSLAPLPHPAMDLILVISLPPPTALPSTAQLKVRVIKATLDFLVASLGPKDRLSLVTFEVGVGGRVRKCPFLGVGKMQSRQRLEKFVDELGVRLEEHQDEFLVRGSKEEKTDVVTAVNHGLDVVLQRKARNPVSGMILVSDASDSTRRAQMDLVLARAEAANVPIHSFGYGRSHDPASLWLMSNHTSGTYTFVKDWYDLRDCVAGCVGGMMSIGLLNMKLHLKIVDSHRFRIRKVSGGPQSILSADGQNVDVDVGELRYGERKEMLIELELDNTDQQKLAQARGGGGGGQRDRAMNATDQFVQAMGLDALAIDDADFVDGMMDRMIDEVPVVEVDGSFFDPAAAKNVSRLAHPVLLTVTLLPMAAGAPRPPSTVSDPVIVRRRMELLASDMITRALVLVSRRNFPQAQRIMGETKRILHTVLQSISRSLPAPSGGGGGGARNRKELLTLSTVRAMQSILQDLQILSEALEDNVELFAHDQRNFGAQQAMILRDQKSWSGRSATERLFWTTDNSIELVSRSTDWVARE